MKTTPIPRLATLGGILFALLVAELMLRPFIAGAALDGKHRGPEYRQFWEGAAVSHFASDYSRSTGNSEIPGAPTLVILGDSHVEAVQVADRFTMGAIAQSELRARGIAVNIRQYGWGGVAVPKYLEEGPQLLNRWNPEWVAVILNRGDLGRESLVSTPRLEFSPQMQATLIPTIEPRVGPFQKRIWGGIRAVAHSSSLFHAVLHRFQEIIHSSLTSDDIGNLASVSRSPDQLDAKDPEDRRVLRALPRASVMMLKDVFEPRLIIVYAAEVGIDSSAKPDDQEAGLLESCRAEGVRCISTRQRMLAMRDREGRFCYGFMNTPLAEGHLNALGHDVVGQLLASEISESSPIH